MPTRGQQARSLNMTSDQTSTAILGKKETFGLQDEAPWSMQALRLLFAVPRVYGPLLGAWEHRFPGTRKAVDRLVKGGYVAYQQGLRVNTRDGLPAVREGKPVSRFRLTAKGRRILRDAQDDTIALHRVFPRLTPAQALKLVDLLTALDLEQPHARFGISAPHATELAGMPERTGRWWVQHLLAGGFVVELPAKLADTREVVPEHWRVTKKLSRELRALIESAANPQQQLLAVEWKLSRSRFLEDIAIARVGVTGATDYDHDVECQKAVAVILLSGHCAHEGSFSVEPRIVLKAESETSPWRFDDNGAEMVFYQPDAELRERTTGGGVRRSVIEFERFQSRRDAWSHIERFLGWLHLRAHPSESAVLRFIVDSEPRVRSYVDLIEAYADSTIDDPSRLPSNPVTLAVSSLERVLGADDPLADSVWFRVSLPSGAETGGVPVLHGDTSPYDDYFGRAQ